MLQSARASSISSEVRLRAVFASVTASWWAMTKQRIGHMGMFGYVIIWIAYPVFSLATVALIYHGTRPDLLRYAVIGVAGSTFIFNAQYFIGQILDEQRMEGTLQGLFLAPCPRLGWLTGFAMSGLLDTILAAAACIVFGMVAFGVRFDLNVPAFSLAFVLFVLSLWGMGFVFSGIGLVIKKSNDLSNLLSPFFTLLGGVYYPVALLPLWLRIPARCLPFGYGMQAMADAALHGAGISQLAPQLLPLAGFAVALPVAGIWTFGWLERSVRESGQLDLY